jgi:phage repressor protein C with HTH and peptisase S24 domain
MSKAAFDDPARQAVRARLKELKSTGMNAKELSRKIGRNETYVQQYLERGSPLSLPEDARQAISRELKIPEDKLRGPQRAPASRASDRPNAKIGPLTPLGGSGVTIPVYGQAMGGNDGRFVFNGGKIADVLAPPALVSVRDAYAVYVVGDSMEPRYKAGETAYVHPHFPVRKGDFVVVQILGDDGEAAEGYIKEFISLDSKRLRLSQLNPRKNIEFPAAAVKSVHRIIMAG